MLAQGFHDVQLPRDLALGIRGGPERKTEVISFASGAERRIGRWADSRRRYHVGYGLKSITDLHRLLHFFEERRGRLFGFRLHDRLDHLSSTDGKPHAHGDQGVLAVEGDPKRFFLIKRYGTRFLPWIRPIVCPILPSLKVSAGGVPLIMGTDYRWDAKLRVIEVFDPDVVSRQGSLSAGFEFDVPVRFDTDRLEIDFTRFNAGSIPDIPLVEISAHAFVHLPA